MDPPRQGAHLEAGGGPRSTTRTGAPVQVVPVRSRRDLKRFLLLPWRIYANDPAWVPPLLMEQKAALDRSKHPYHQHADSEYFLALRGADVVGRIVATVNRQHTDFHEDKTGFFGFFECIDDDVVARALLDAAEAWLLERGMERVRGPMNFSTNEESVSPGVLIDGFEHPPQIMTGHTPPYYARLIEAAGYGKSKDLFAYWIPNDGAPERLVRGTARLQERAGVVLRPIDLKRLQDEVGIIRDVYNSAWERNWGFVPMTDAEFDHLAKQLKPVVDPGLCLIAELDGETVGFAIALPDFNQALKHLDGRLFPFGLLKLLWYRRKIDRVRVITLGLTPGHRRSGADALMYYYYLTDGHALGYNECECSWILDDNWEMRRGLERMGASVYKTYRVYEKPLP